MLWGVLLCRNLLAFNCWASLAFEERKVITIQYFSVLLLPNYCTTIRHFPPGYFGLEREVAWGPNSSYSIATVTLWMWRDRR